MTREFKDLIVNEQDGKKRIRLLNRDGTIALNDVYVEISSPISQNGDSFGALETNLLLEISDGIPQIKIDGGTY
ncbi:MAG: hypothetical protein RR087_10940 [Oscillospiraceae bacterium]